MKIGLFQQPPRNARPYEWYDKSEFDLDRVAKGAVLRMVSSRRDSTLISFILLFLSRRIGEGADIPQGPDTEDDPSNDLF